MSETSEKCFISYHDSWITVDGIVGCPYNCAYCILKPYNRCAMKPVQTASASTVAERLVAHRYFLRNKTPITIGTQSDAFYRSNVDYTLTFLDWLERRDFHNPVCIPTKTPISNSLASRLAKFKNIKLIVFLSFSGLPRSLESGIDAAGIQASFRVLAENGIPTVHYFRPLIASNSDESRIEHILGVASEYARCSIAIGLKFSPELRAIYCANELLRMPEVASSHGEWFPLEMQERVWRISKEVFPGYPVFRHTSCAVSSILAIPDYNATMYNRAVCELSLCPSWQRQFCSTHKEVPSTDKVKFLLTKIGLDVAFQQFEDRILSLEQLSQEDYIFLLHNLSFPIEALSIKYSNIMRGSIIDRHYVVKSKC